MMKKSTEVESEHRGTRVCIHWASSADVVNGIDVTYVIIANVLPSLRP